MCVCVVTGLFHTANGFYIYYWERFFSHHAHFISYFTILGTSKWFQSEIQSTLFWELAGFFSQFSWYYCFYRDSVHISTNFILLDGPKVCSSRAIVLQTWSCRFSSAFTCHASKNGSSQRLWCNWGKKSIFYQQKWERKNQPKRNYDRIRTTKRKLQYSIRVYSVTVSVT